MRFVIFKFLECLLFMLNKTQISVIIYKVAAGQKSKRLVAISDTLLYMYSNYKKKSFYVYVLN